MTVLGSSAIARESEIARIPGTKAGAEPGPMMNPSLQSANGSHHFSNQRISIARPLSTVTPKHNNDDDNNNNADSEPHSKKVCDGGRPRTLSTPRGGEGAAPPAFHQPISASAS